MAGHWQAEANGEPVVAAINDCSLLVTLTREPALALSWEAEQTDGTVNMGCGIDSNPKISGGKYR